MKAVAFFSLLVAASTFAEVEGLPPVGKPRAMDFAKPQERKLDNGLRVIAVTRSSEPLVTVGLAVKSGAETDPPQLAGLAHFTAGLLQRGTATRTAPQIAQELEELGTSMKAEATWDGTVAAMSGLSVHADKAMAIFADVVLHPRFAAEELERLRKERIDEARVNLEQPGDFAKAAAARLILGAGPYGHTATGTPDSLARITSANVQDFYKTAFHPADATLIIVGDLQPEAAFALAQNVFGGWPANSEKPAAPREPAGPPAPSAVLIDMPDAGQAAVYLGCPEPARTAEPAYYAGQVANAVLGGGYSARLNLEVRVKRGLSYGAGSRVSGWREAGIFGAACQTKNQSAAEVVQVIQGELKKLASGAPTAPELTARRLVLTGSFERELETNEGYVKRIADFVLHGLPADAFARTIAGYNAVTPEEVRDFAAAQLPIDRMSVVVVGRARECEKPLRELFPRLRVIPKAKVSLDEPTLMAPPKPPATPVRKK
jgi:zinc protease